jgi:hypothetical protein
MITGRFVFYSTTAIGSRAIIYQGLSAGMINTIYPVNSFSLKENTMLSHCLRLCQLIVCCTGLFISAAAQQKPAAKPATAVPVTRFKPPMVKSYIDKYSGNTLKLSAEEGKRIIINPLRVADDKNTSYKISSYQFAYKRQGVTENEETGEVSPASDMVAQRFTESPLPDVYDKQGRLFFAPELKITIQ